MNNGSVLIRNDDAELAAILNHSDVFILQNPKQQCANANYCCDVLTSIDFRNYHLMDAAFDLERIGLRLPTVSASEKRLLRLDIIETDAMIIQNLNESMFFVYKLFNINSFFLINHLEMFY